MKNKTSRLGHYVCGKWEHGTGKETVLYNAVTGARLATTSTHGLDFGYLLNYGRTTGGPALRKMTFHERGLMLKALALHLHGIKDKYYPISYQTGATKVDSWIDIEGGIANLFANASLRRVFGSERFYVDGDTVPLSKKGTFVGHHIMVPREGIAIHINAFNFPVWGMLEKIAVNLLAGMPALVKPATVTSFLTESVVRDIIASGILPEGALQLICGPAGDLLNHTASQDVVTFTGSAETGRKLKAHPRIIDQAVPFNMEADSLNCSVLAPDAAPGTEEFSLFVKEVHREMTIKCGQKCTAIRRIIVPEPFVDAVCDALGKRMDKTIIGDPAQEKTRMGALAGQVQRNEVLEKVEVLLQHCTVAHGSVRPDSVVGADPEKGAFMGPLLLHCANPLKNDEVHGIEAFGPVATLMPYKTMDEAIELSKRGRGSLVCSIATADDKTAAAFSYGAAAWHGRILVLNKESAVESTGHGSPMPLLVHGGPGRAGGGEEMGGKRGVLHYLQRTAIQGTPTTIAAITKQFQVGARQNESVPHVFRKYFEELEVGDTVTTAKHTVSEADVSNFANVSGDHFYAHVDATSLEDTIFEKPVAHGYYILSKAAGLFVDPAKGPVLLNYGIDSCRFLKPVYPGTTIGVKLTVLDKMERERREDDKVDMGMVRFLVDVYDDEGETVALAVILTMVKKREQHLPAVD